MSPSLAVTLARQACISVYGYKELRQDFQSFFILLYTQQHVDTYRPITICTQVDTIITAILLRSHDYIYKRILLMPKLMTGKFSSQRLSKKMICNKLAAGIKNYRKLKNTMKNNTPKEMQMICKNKCYLKSLSYRTLGSVRHSSVQLNRSLLLHFTQAHKDLSLYNGCDIRHI